MVSDYDDSESEEIELCPYCGSEKVQYFPKRIYNAQCKDCNEQWVSCMDGELDEDKLN